MAGSNPNAPGEFSPGDLFFLDEVHERVKVAHGIVAGLIERRHSKPTAISLIQASQALRAALGLLEADQAARREAGRKLLSRSGPLDLRSFARLVARDGDQPLRLRAAAIDALGCTSDPIPPYLREVIDLAALIDAYVGQGMTVADAAAKATREPEWVGFKASAAACSFRFVKVAARVLRRGK